MYSKIFHFEDVLLSCKSGTRSMYWQWLKKNGAHDYITYVLNEEENESGVLMHPNRGDIVIDRITAFNLNYIITKLKLISNNF